MYGLIHQAARSMVLETFGQEAWSDILRATGFGEQDFVTARTYDDTQTLALVSAIAARAGLSAPDALTAFGRYWVSFTDRTHYASVMRISGDTLEEFLGNLDRMHASIKVAIPETNMPSFRIIKRRENGIDVEYVSSRQGLEPFVAGLMQGLMERFNQPGGVRHAGSGPDGAIFSLDYDRGAQGEHAAA